MKQTLHLPEALDVSNWIAGLRRKSGLTQRQLARLLKVFPSEVHKMETREKKIDVIQFYLICKALKADPARESRLLFQAFNARRR